MNEFGLLFEGIIGPLLLWIKEEQTGPAVAGIIVLLGLVIIGIALTQTIRDYSSIRNARFVIGEGDEKQFARHFNTIDQDFASIKKIGPAWLEFKETLFRPKFDENKELISPCENTVRPQEYFNLRNLGMGPNFVKIFPSVFIGIGLSLTFLGLIAALSEAVEAINASAGSADSIQAAIANLLKISSAKFYASLFALFTSIVMTISIRSMTWALTTSLNRLNQTLESSVRYLGPEKLAITANEILREQLIQLQTFNTDLALKIGEQVQLSLSQSLAPVVQKLDNMGGHMAQQSIDAIRGIAEEVTKGIEGATGSSMDRVANTLDEVSTKLGGLSETLGGALSNFDADFKKMLDGLKDSLKQSAEGVSSGVNDSMSKMSEGIGKTTEDITKIISGLTSTIQNLANTGAEISLQGGEELKRQVEAASKQASEQMSLAGKALSEGFQLSTNDLVASMNGASFQLKELEASLLSLPGQLKSINTELSSSATQIEIASEQFSSASNGIRGLIEPLAKYATETRSSISDITNSFNIVSNQIGEASLSINKSVDTLGSQVSSQLEKLNGADEQLAKLLMGIENSTTRVLSDVNRFVSEIDNGFASSIGMLQESIGEFEEVIDSIGKLIIDAKKG